MRGYCEAMPIATRQNKKSLDTKEGEENYRCRVTGHGDCNEAQPREVEDVEALIAHDEEIEEIHRSIAGRDGENFDHVVVVLENTRYYDTTGCEESQKTREGRGVV